MPKFFKFIAIVVVLNIPNYGIAQIYDAVETSKRKVYALKKAPNVSSRVGKTIMNANKLHTAGDLIGALAELEKYNRDLSPNDMAVFYSYQAGLNHMLGKNDQALKLRLETLKYINMPTDQEDSMLFTIAAIYYELQDFENAIRFLNHWLIYHENGASYIYHMLASSYQEVGEFNLAREYLEASMEALQREQQMTKDDSSATQIVSNTTEEMITEGLAALEKAATENDNELSSTHDKQYWPIYHFAAKYPKAARKKKLDGKVMLQFDLDMYGKTKNIEILESSDPIFESSALSVIEQYKFILSRKPRDEVFVKGVTQQIDFRYKDRKIKQGTMRRAVIENTGKDQ